MSGEPAKPGWDAPSSITGTVIVGSADSGVIVWTPAPGIAKLIVCRPEAALAFRIACRSEPGPLSLVLVTR